MLTIETIIYVPSTYISRKAGKLHFCCFASSKRKTAGVIGPRPGCRLAEITLKRLWNRSRLSDQFLAEVSEWLLTVGWALFFAGSTYAAVRTSAVENWPPISSKRIQAELNAVRAGKFDFAALEHLFDGGRGDDQVDDEDDRSND